MADASEVLEIAELLQEANRYGDGYGRGFEEGFEKGYLFSCEKDKARIKSLHDKHQELNKRWGLSD